VAETKRKFVWSQPQTNLKSEVTQCHQQPHPQLQWLQLLSLHQAYWLSAPPLR